MPQEAEAAVPGHAQKHHGKSRDGEGACASAYNTRAAFVFLL